MAATIFAMRCLRTRSKPTLVIVEALSE
jgi:hypothetical protein